MGITKMTGGALIRQHYPRMVFTRIHRQHFGWAEFHADAAALAPGRIQDDLSTWAFFDWGFYWDGRRRLGKNIRHEITFQWALFLGLFYYKKHS